MLSHVVDFVSIIIECSVQAVLLIVLVWAGHRLFGKTMTYFCKWCLWVIIIARLMFPFSFNAQLPLADYISNTVAEHFLNKGATVVSGFRLELMYETPSNFTYHDGAFTYDEDQNYGKDILAVLSVIYVAVTLMMLMVFIRRNHRLGVSIRENSRPAGEEMRKILDHCRFISDVSNYVDVRITPLVVSPSLFGYSRPVILIPSELSRNVTPKDLKFIFLHELMHIKNRDILIVHLLNIVRIIHWFNPLVHILYSQVTNDREILCDERVLGLTGKRSAKRYGNAVLKAIESASQLRFSPIGIGLFDGTRLIRRRIVMIRDFGLNTVSNKARYIGAFFTVLMLFWSFVSFAKNADESSLEDSVKGSSSESSFLSQRFLPSPEGHQVPFFRKNVSCTEKYRKILFPEIR